VSLLGGGPTRGTGNSNTAQTMMTSSVILLSPGINDLYVDSMVIPLPNGKHLNITDSANYRGIALSSVYGKLFDLLLLCRYCHNLRSRDLQFGTKKRSISTDMCSMILKETIVSLCE